MLKLIRLKINQLKLNKLKAEAKLLLEETQKEMKNFEC